MKEDKVEKLARLIYIISINNFKFNTDNSSWVKECCERLADNAFLAASIFYQQKLKAFK